MFSIIIYRSVMAAQDRSFYILILSFEMHRCMESCSALSPWDKPPNVIIDDLQKGLERCKIQNCLLLLASKLKLSKGESREKRFPWKNVGCLGGGQCKSDGRNQKKLLSPSQRNILCAEALFSLISLHRENTKEQAKTIRAPFWCNVSSWSIFLLNLV